MNDPAGGFDFKPVPTSRRSPGVLSHSHLLAQTFTKAALGRARPTSAQDLFPLYTGSRPWVADHTKLVPKIWILKEYGFLFKDWVVGLVSYQKVNKDWVLKKKTAPREVTAACPVGGWLQVPLENGLTRTACLGLQEGRASQGTGKSVGSTSCSGEELLFQRKCNLSLLQMRENIKPENFLFTLAETSGLIAVLWSGIGEQKHLQSWFCCLHEVRNKLK